MSTISWNPHSIHGGFMAASMGFVSSCNCIGPQKGQPRCPCQMRGIIERDGRWVVPEQDLGPVRPTPTTPNARDEG